MATVLTSALATTDISGKFGPMKTVIVLLFLGALQPLLCQEDSSKKPTVPNLPNTNAEILRLAIEDQWDRGADMFGQASAPKEIDWKRVDQRDEQRHVEVRKLLAENRLKTSNDYYFAALIFQHSDKANDLMFGHILAMTAVAKGNFTAKWLAAATLDRYLNALGQPQIFGTQFHDAEGRATTMNPYDRSALSDFDRALWCVVPLKEQERILQDMNHGGAGGTTQTRDCR